MSWIWIFPFLLTLTLSLVFYPLFSRRGCRPLPLGIEGNYKEELLQSRDGLLRQLKEIQLEETDSSEESISIRESLERELALILGRLDTQTASESTTQSEPSLERSTIDIAFGSAVIVLLLALISGLYILIGTPKDVPPSEPTQSVTQQDIKDMVIKLEKRLATEPDNIEGWMRLGRSKAFFGDLPGAIKAYNHVLSRQPDNLVASSTLAELLVQSGDAGQMAIGVGMFREILKKDANNPGALWFLGGVSFRDGQTQEALALWNRLLPLLKEGSEARSTVLQAIERAGG